jgi:ABC-type transport system substrate-binding protein
MKLGTLNAAGRAVGYCTAAAVVLFAGVANVTSHAAPANGGADPNKVLRYAFEVAETSFDPQKISDVYSNIVNSAMFDTPLRYDPLARPAKLVPNTTASMPELSPDYKTLTVRIRPGIYFADHPVFKGKKRELTAEDYVYSIKRLFDPKLSAPLLAEVEGYFVGSEEMMKRVRKAGKMDYDAPLEGLKALDRYTLQIKFVDPKPIWIYNLADCRVSCAVAREIVEHYGDDIGSHPVGTGAYQLSYWKRSSKMVFDANPNFRETYYDAQPAADDAEGQAILARLKGKRLPMIGKFEIYIIEERQPRFLAFQRREHDVLWILPEDFANLAIPGNKLAPNLRKLGIQMQQVPALDITFAYFNMDDPTVGGYTAEKVALRRAISLAYKTHDEIQMVRKGQAVLAHAPYSPGVAGYDPDFKTSINEYNPAKARALLDMYGYVDKDGDGWRDMPDGSPLQLKHNSTPTDRDRQLDEIWKRSMDEIGIKISITKGKWPDHLKASDAGKLMMWQLGGSASSPDADTWLQSLYGPNAGFKGNRARFKLKAYDEAFEKASKLADSPERTKLYQEMAKIVAAYAPWKINTHRILTDLNFPYVVGFRRPLVQSQNWWMFADIDLAKLREYEGK